MQSPHQVRRVRASSGAGWSSPAARRAHNPKVAGSNPAPATKDSEENPSPAGIFFVCDLYREGFEAATGKAGDRFGRRRRRTRSAEGDSILPPLPKIQKKIPALLGFFLSAISTGKGSKLRQARQEIDSGAEGAERGAQRATQSCPRSKNSVVNPGIRTDQPLDYCFPHWCPEYYRAISKNRTSFRRKPESRGAKLQQPECRIPAFAGMTRIDLLSSSSAYRSYTTGATG